MNKFTVKIIQNLFYKKKENDFPLCLRALSERNHTDITLNISTSNESFDAVKQRVKTKDFLHERKKMLGYTGIKTTQIYTKNTENLKIKPKP